MKPREEKKRQLRTILVGIHRAVDTRRSILPRFRRRRPQFDAWTEWYEPRHPIAGNRAAWFDLSCDNRMGSRRGMRRNNGRRRSRTSPGRNASSRSFVSWPPSTRTATSSLVARPSERPDRPGPARRRLSRLESRQGPCDRRIPGRTWRPRRRPAPRGRVDGRVTREKARRERRDEPGGHFRRSVDSRKPRGSGRQRHRGFALPHGLRSQGEPVRSWHGSHHDLRRRRGHRERPAVWRGLGPTRGAAWERSTSRSTPSFIARSRSSRSSTSTQTTREPARFLIEAEITGGLEHPGIVPVYGLGAYADGRPYYAMRFVRGDSLKEAIGRFQTSDINVRRRGPRSAEAGGVARAAQAIAPIHRRLQRDRLRTQPGGAPPRYQAGEYHCWQPR